MIFISKIDNHLINFFFDLTFGCRPKCLVTTISRLFGRFLAPVTGVTKERIETTIKKLNVLRSKINNINDNNISAATSREWLYVIDLMLLSCCVWMGRLQIGIHLPLRSMSQPIRICMVDEINRLISEHRSLWLLRSRIGGLDESSSFLERVRDEMMAGLTNNDVNNWKMKGMREGDVTPEKKRL
jgi:hypothetical protein